MKSIVKGGLAATALLLAGCGGLGGAREAGPVASLTPSGPMVVDGTAKLGPPFTVGGTTYTPIDIPEYDDVGYAGYYGDDLAGRPTANGESFNPNGISAAHKTLPLPSYVEVTALDTGRTILVRVNDRGPMVNDRLIDLSRGAAEQLGITGGAVGVRVRRTNPPMSERAQLRSGQPVLTRLATPDSLLAILRRKLKALPVPAGAATKPPVSTAVPIATSPTIAKPGDDRFIVEGPGAKPVAKPATPVTTRPAPVAATGNYVVQVAAFSTEARAAAAAKSVGGSVTSAGRLWRVRVGPFASEADAQAALGKAKAKGFRDAVVMRDR